MIGVIANSCNQRFGRYRGPEQHPSTSQKLLGKINKLRRREKHLFLKKEEKNFYHLERTADGLVHP